MKFLIVGANFYNKGAQLMLVSLIEQLNELFLDITICVSPTIGTRQELENLGVEILDFPLLHVGTGKRFMWALKYGNILKFLKTKYRGNIKLKEVDVVFDLSGFAFGEQWGSEPTKNLQLLIKHVKSNNGKYILMPQAFGPFNSSEIISDMQKIQKSADLIFARDQMSLQHLLEISAKKNNIHSAPDITLFNKSVKVEKNLNCCIVPNSRMLDKGLDSWGDSYISYLNKIIKIILEKSPLKILLLVHDKIGGDYKMAEQLKNLFSDDERVALFLEEDPIKIKEIISKSYFIVGSRFHALASALSTNVPCVGLGWSHKYKMLFKDYDIADFAFNEPNEEILLKVDDLINQEKLEKIVDNLKIQNEKLKIKNLEMWNIVRNLIES